MAAGLAAFYHHKIRQAAVVALPALADEPRRFAAGDDGGQQDIALPHQPRQLQGEPRPGNDGVGPALDGGFHQFAVVVHGCHDVDAYHPPALGQLPGTADLLLQGPAVGRPVVLGKIRLPVPGVGGGDHAHGPAGCHGAGQAAQRDAHPHTALQQRHFQRMPP